MTAHAIPLLDAASARAADAAAVAAGTSTGVLMARAAGHLARTVLEVAGRAHGLDVDIVVGRGDNGGDGWAAAPLLAARGARVRVVAADGRADVRALEPTDGGAPGAASAARRAWIASGGRCATVADVRSLLRPDGRPRAQVVVDCLLGTGAEGPLRGPVATAAAAVHAARRAGALVVACDVPSGVSADDGSAVEGAVVADATVSLGGLKRGLLMAPGPTHAGRIRVGGLGAAFVVPDTGWWALTATGARPLPLDPLGDKRDRGSVLVVAGRTGGSGAAVLAGIAALSVGAGLVTVAVPESVRAEVAAAHPALMVVGLPADADGGLHPDAVHPLDRLLDDGRFDAVVAGPGLGTGVGAAAVVAHLRRRAPRLVLDADALNVHRDHPDELGEHVGALVLTPHARELDRIGGHGTHAARATRAVELARRWDAVIVAKGPGTLVAEADGRVYVTPLGTPELGTAGTGDVLAGAVAAALARDVRAEDGQDIGLAVARAVWWHAAAGIRAADRQGSGMVATDVVAALPEVLRALEAAVPGTDPGPDGDARGHAAAGLIDLTALLGTTALGLGVRSTVPRVSPMAGR